MVAQVADWQEQSCRPDVRPSGRLPLSRNAPSTRCYHPLVLQWLRHAMRRWNTVATSTIALARSAACHMMLHMSAHMFCPSKCDSSPPPDLPGAPAKSMGNPPAPPATPNPAPAAAATSTAPATRACVASPSRPSLAHQPCPALLLNVQSDGMTCHWHACSTYCDDGIEYTCPGSSMCFDQAPCVEPVCETSECTHQAREQ